VEAGRFREDLYYRLNGIKMVLPPLRARGQDVVLIARALLNTNQMELNPGIRGFDQNALNAMLTYHWPGNVRELENRIKKALIMANGSTISPEDLGLSEEPVDGTIPLSQAKENFARDYIERVLVLNEGNRAKTAADLQVDPRTIYRYLESKREDD
jgi:DNA-binding NtrC family response regulator